MSQQRQDDVTEAGAPAERNVWLVFEVVFVVFATVRLQEWGSDSGVPIWVGLPLFGLSTTLFGLGTAWLVGRVHRIGALGHRRLSPRLFMLTGPLALMITSLAWNRLTTDAGLTDQVGLVGQGAITVGCLVLTWLTHLEMLRRLEPADD